jgi:hypothetical protein
MLNSKFVLRYRGIGPWSESEGRAKPPISCGPGRVTPHIFGAWSRSVLERQERRDIRSDANAQELAAGAKVLKRPRRSENGLLRVQLQSDPGRSTWPAVPPVSAPNWALHRRQRGWRGAFELAAGRHRGCVLGGGGQSGSRLPQRAKCVKMVPVAALAKGLG